MLSGERARTLVVLSLLTALIIGACLVAFASEASELPLLVAGVFATTALALASAFVARRTGEFVQRQYGANQGPRSLWLFLTRQQWMALMLGLTAVAGLTAAGAGVKVVSGPQNVAAAVPGAVVPPTQPTTATAPAPVETSSSVESSPSATGSTGSPSPSGDQVVTPRPGATTYLDVTDPVNGNFDSDPVSMSGKRYPRSVKMYCSQATYNYIEWNVAASTSFSTTLGIGDDTSGAFGAIAEFIFYDQDGHQLGPPYDVSVGHPRPVAIDLRGIVHLRVTCAGRDSKTNERRSFYAALGDAIIVT